MLNKDDHKFHMVQIISALYEDPLLVTKLGFKGGTACAWFYDLPRFSTDLDFDYLWGDDEQDNSTVDRVIARVTEIIGKSYTLDNQSKKYHTLFWLISYQKGSTHIKVEVSTRKVKNHYLIKNFFGAKFNLMVFPDVVANKLIAIMDRKKMANRDLFDAHFFLSSPHATEINYDLIKERTAMDKKQFYTKLATFLETVDNHNILSGLGEILTISQKHWAKTHLLIELKKQVQLQLFTTSTPL